MMIEDIRACVDELFCSGLHADLPPLVHVPDLEPQVVLDGYLYRFPMVNRENGINVNLDVFAEIGEAEKADASGKVLVKLGGKLWEQEVRALIRFSGSEHPAIPEIYDGDVRACSDGRRIGYVITDRKDALLDSPEVLAALRTDVLWTVRQVSVLASGLALLHRHNLFHRNLAADAIEVVHELGVAENRALRLSRFEMSTFRSNLLRWFVGSNDALDTAEIMRLVPRDRRALAGIAPERLEWIFPRKAADRSGARGSPREGPEDEVPAFPDQPQADVYSLGVLAFQWLVDDLDEQRLEDAFPRRASPAHTGAQDVDHDAWNALHAWMQGRINMHGHIPVRLRRLLGRMTSRYWRNRPTAAEVCDEIARLYEDLAAEFSDDSAEREYMIAIVPGRFEATMWRWGWLTYAPNTPDGFDELKQLIEEDLEGGFLEYCPGGFTRFDSSDDDGDKEFATYVLRGRRAGYFASEFVDYRTQSLVPQALIIKYVLDWNDPRARNYPEETFRRRLPPAVIYSWNSDLLRPSLAAVDRPRWTLLLDSVRQNVAVPPAHAEMDEALRWLLSVQWVEMNARQYAFKRAPGSPSTGDVELEFDSRRDADRIAADPLLSWYARNRTRRPDFTEFFSTLESRNFRNYVRWWPSDSRGRPHRDRSKNIGTDVVSIAPNRIRLQTTAGSVVPEEGWIEPEDDGLNRVTHDRQVRAQRELMDRPALLGALTRRQSFFSPLAQWEGVGAAFLDRTAREVPELRGIASHAVLTDFLNSDPFYALQGPPGTGKTTVAARAVRATLKRDPAARILVAAQSHYALDHLAATIMRWLPEESVLVRVVSRHREDRIAHPDVFDLLPSRLSAAKLREIDAVCKEKLKMLPPGGERQVVTAWMHNAEGAELEIRERLLRGANVVFATCAASTRNAVGTGGDYDWVIIEEAAKAWPTELMIPLVRGHRWALLGDHQQLPAFRRREIGDFLHECATAPEASLRRTGEKAKRFEEVFDMFAQCFTAQAPAPAARRHMRAIRSATGRLLVQYRMAKDIAELVSGAFYEDALDTPDDLVREHDLTRPSWLEGAALVWLDTSEVKWCYEERYWKNQGEAKIVRSLLQQLRPRPLSGRGKTEREQRLAVLSPYRQQNELIERELSNVGLLKEFSGLIHTVDAFQGREADIVVISLVRDSDLELPSVTARLGFLVDQHRINVLFSRARDLLVLVGDLSHFESAADLAVESGRQSENAPGMFWKKVCTHVRRDGRVIPAQLLKSDAAAAQVLDE